MLNVRPVVIACTLVMLASPVPRADAAQCGSSAAGFSAWKQEFAGEARAKGVSASTIQALMATNYAQATINADRGQRSFSLSLDQFLAKRGGPAIVARGRTLKQSQGALFASIQSRTGVPPGPLLAIWGMETGFGSQRGNQHMLSSIATLAYDCRRSAYFTEHLYAALQLIDQHVIHPQCKNSRVRIATFIARLNPNIHLIRTISDWSLRTAASNLESRLRTALSVRVNRLS